MHLAQISRYPIKSVGVQDLAEALLEKGRILAGDRRWAVAHEAAKLSDGWSHCSNFIRGGKAPRLMAITCEGEGDQLTLHHPDQASLAISLPGDAEDLIAWLTPLTEANRAAPAKLVPAATGMTDNKNPWLSLLSQSSLDALSHKAGKELERRRFRANLWLEGAAPWEEWNWMGRTLRIGEAELKITDRIERCTATMANPATGKPDTQTLKLLEENWGHKDFGVFAEVTKSGPIRPGDPITLIS